MPNYEELDGHIDLTCFDDDYQKAEVRCGDAPADTVPDGYYEVRIEETRLKKTPRTGNPMLIWKLRILGPKCRNSAITKTRIITAKTLPFVKEDLQILGLRLPKFSELEEHLDQMQERVVSIYKKTSGEGWSDVYFTRPRISPPATAGDGDDSRLFPPQVDDDLPF